MKRILNGAMKPCEITVGHDAHVGGRLTVRGHARVHHNLRVDGYLEAAHLKNTAKGLFRNAEQLSSAYPRPEKGWWALVGEGLPAEVYMVVDGLWTPTGRMAGEPEIDASGWFEELLYIQQQIESLGHQYSKLNTDIAKLIGTQTDVLALKIDKLAALLNRGIYCYCNCNGNSGSTKPTEPTEPDNPDNPNNPEQPDKKDSFAVVFVSGDECAYADITGSKNVLKDAVKQKSYTVDCTPNEYLWICIEKDIKVDGFKSSGFELPVEAPVLRASKNKKLPQFRCWRTSGRPQSSEIKIEVC